MPCVSSDHKPVKVNADTVYNENRAAKQGRSMGVHVRMPLYLVRTKEENLQISDSSPIRSGFGLKVNENGFSWDVGVN